MSRSAHQLRQQQKQQLLAQQQQIADNEAAAAAAELFDLFCVATTMRQVLGLYRNMCDVLGMRPAPLNEFYPKLKTKVRSWKAQALWKKFDARAAHRAYAKGTACTGSRVLVIGAGPCGLRTAIEAQLLGAKVVVVEKRDRISRNNVLHLWPFVITDLRNLGAKKFYGKFCAGSIDHISIRQLQCILLKVALLLGVEVHEGISFERTIEPSGDGSGWRASVTPADHAVSHYEFDVLIGADGKRNTLEGFKRKEFRGKLAIAITANFINKKTEAEAKAEEISGVAFIFNQSFFKELYHTTGIDLENIVYYKDETHYFVMTAKKHSLLDKGVIIQDFADPAELLAPGNVNTEKLLDYAREAAEFSTKYQMPNLEFAVNHYGKPDVAMFDFTSMFAAETSCRVIVRKGFRLLQCLVGDSLLEPFWPTGSGCARGFLSSMDAAYALKLWSNPRNSILGVLAQRESIYRLLNQTTPENLQRDIGSYTVDPATRYPNLNRSTVNVWQVKHLIDTDDKAILEQTFMDTNALQTTQGEIPMRRKRRNGDTMSLSTVLLSWICAQLRTFEFTKDLKEVSDVFTNGKVLCALINRYRPDLIDYNSVKDLSPAECNERAFKILDREMQIPRIMSGKDSIQLNTVDSKVWLNYLEQICEVFRGEVPHVKHPKMDFAELREKHRTNSALGKPDFSKLLQISSSNKQSKSKSPQDMVDVPQNVQRRSVLTEEQLKRQRGGPGIAAASSGLQPQQAQIDTPRRAKKRRSVEKAANIEERQQRLKEIESNRQERLSKRRQQRYQQTQNFYKSLHMLQANNLLRESDDSTPFEDYSIFLYRQQAPEFNDRVKDLERKLLYPDRDRNDIPSAIPRGNADEQFSDRIKSMEQRMASTRNHHGTEKKPKDLMRAIGKIESSDWNVREIEKKIEQSRKTEVHGPKGREKVPKWSKEQFQARQKKMSKPARQESVEEKFKEIDQTLKNLDKQLKEGRILEVGERGRNKVASIAGQFVKKDESNTNSDDKNPSNTVIPKSSSKVALAFKKQAASEKCHFCKQTVYLMEKINAEGLVLHRSCLKCHHCHTNLRPGGYAFDRDDPNGRFYCTQHFRLPAKAVPKPAVRRSGQRKSTQHQQQKSIDTAGAAVDTTATIQQTANISEPKTPEKLRVHADNVAQLDLLDRGQTPERIEFENTDAISDGEPSEEHIMLDENEWSGRNFLPESNNDSESDLSSSDESETESESDMFEEANDSPIGAQTLQLVTDWIGKQNYTDTEDSDDFYDSSDGVPDDGKDDTEGEEFKKARELRREEVRLLPLPPNLPTDTETEKKVQNEDKENIDLTAVQVNEKTSTTTNGVKGTEADIRSEKSWNSEKSFQSANSVQEDKPLAPLNQVKKTPPPTKAEIEKMEQKSERKLSADIDAINEKLFHLNNVVKMNKDLEVLAKENLVKSDIFKKLNMKEKWLADNNVGNVNPLAPKSRFEDKYEKLMRKPNGEEDSKGNIQNQQDSEKEKDKLNGAVNLSRNNSQKNNKKANFIVSPGMKRKGSTNTSRSNSFKSNASILSPKLGGRKKNSNSFDNKDSDKMEIENILDVVKKLDISNNKSVNGNSNEGKDQEKDMGKMMYDIENRASPSRPDKRMAAKMKEIQAQSFAGTMDNIKSQFSEPTISSHQGGSNLDLSKYFPNQKQEKPLSSATNKNQKTLKDVDLTKYFPPSPVPQRRTSVLTVADKLKQTQGEKPAPLIKSNSQIGKIGTQDKDARLMNSSPKPNSICKTKTMPSLRDHQLDGAVDITKKLTPLKIKTSTASAAGNKKGGIKIIKKIVPKGTKAKKIINKKNHDESDRILDEILDADGQAVRSPSLEYQQLFKEEKSPSDDISDKIERILEETGIDLGLPSKQDNRKKLTKTKSLGEEEFSHNSRKLSLQTEEPKDDGRRLNGVQNILKRFESMSSVKSDASSNCAFKLRRMESTTNNLDKSRESLQSRESDTLSDLEKTMEYLKSEWKNEATNFLQNKRDNFFAQKRATEQANSVPVEEEKKKTCYEGLPIQYRESKIAKFFGLTPKSSEKTLKKKSPEKKLTVSTDRKKKSKSKSPIKVEKANRTPSKAYNSLEELAILSALKKIENSHQQSHRNEENVNQKNSADDLKLEKPKISNMVSQHRNGTVGNTAVNQTDVTSSDALNVDVRKPEPVQRTEDIKNLPKTGCDKSRSNSRRGSLASIQSRRLSDVSLTENTAVPVDMMTSTQFENSKTETETPTEPAAEAEMEPDECDSLRTTISKSPSEALVTVQMRGSSEDESIEKLFSQFSDEMLVDVEFDSNDELVAITPRVDLEKADTELVGNISKSKYIDPLLHKELIHDQKTLHSTDSPSKYFTAKNSDGMDGNQFPVRPQRRQKSTSSSSEPSVPTVPQRLKKKLNQLSPSTMPPSVQDVLNHLTTNDQAIPTEPNTFPRTINESNSETEKSSKMESPIKLTSTPNFEHQRPKESAEVNPNTNLSNQPSKKDICLPSNMAPSPLSSSSLNSPKALTRAQQSENSTPSQESESDLRKLIQTPKTQSKEKSLDWDMEKLPNSPMPRQRFVHPDRGPLKDIKLRDLSPTSSIKLLNNLSPQSKGPDEVSLRKALIERDKAYEKLEKPELNFRDQSRDKSLASLKEPTPMSVTQTPRLSRANTQEKSTTTIHEGTPPMLKKLVIPSDTTSSPPESSRRSSFAFIELMDTGEPVIVPMPKKLEIPKIAPKYVPERNIEETEVFKNRSWPKPETELDYRSTSPELSPEKEKPKSDSLIPEIFKGRQWPDGKTDFSKLQPMDRRAPSKSYNDLRRPQSPVRSVRGKLHNSTQSLHNPTSLRSTRSSADTDHQSYISSLIDSDQSHDHTGRLSNQHKVRSTAEDGMDASTRMLLDRSKRLRNRKQDFVNERVAERNPYMREVIGDDHYQRAASDTDDDLDYYRPKNYSRSSGLKRFPTSSASGRTRNSISPYHDYTSPIHSAYTTPANDYTANMRRNFYGASLPLGSSLIYQNTPTTSYGLNSYDRGIRDYLRRSSPDTTSHLRHRSYLNKDSCVQSESESTSPDEVELNSATEISTDSEFDHDEVIRETPKIFIDDTHIRKPTKVQIKSAIVETTGGQRFHTASNAQSKGGSYLKKYQASPPQPQFKPLVQVDPTLLSSNRSPLQNPRPGDYLLNKTASTEGIASKKSLELKKRYLLGEQSNGNKIQKSGSTSVLDSRIRSFQSNISECQKLLNPSSDISPSMKTFLDRTKLGENTSNKNNLMHSATTNVLRDLKVEITIQKASSTASTDNEKENVFVNSKNELNKGMEYSDTINIALLDNMDKMSSPTTPTNKQTVIETIDLITPEKAEPTENNIIDLTIPEKQSPIKDQTQVEKSKDNTSLLRADSNKIADGTSESPVKSDRTLVEDMSKPDVSKDIKQSIPDILHHVEKEQTFEKHLKETSHKESDERERLLSNSGDDEKMDSPEKHDGNFENDTVQIQVPNIPWNTHNKNNVSSATNSSWSSSSSTSIEDIQHYILESTTSPDTNNTNGLSVPRVEIHDTSGTLMQIDSLMVVDGKYIGDPEDLKFMEVPEGIIVPETAAVKTTEVDEEIEHDNEPITATPEPAEPTIIEAKDKQQEPLPPSLPDHGPPLPKLKYTNLKFDTKNENKLESLKHLPLIVEQSVEQTKAVKPMTLNLCNVNNITQQKSKTQITPTTTSKSNFEELRSPITPLTDNDKTPTAEQLSRGSDSETEPTGTGQALTETELSDWTADDCISENFIDAEFVLNSNKGTIKRNKKNRRRSSDLNSKLLTSDVIHEDARIAPVVDIESMFNTIDIEDIEFMDTGSEGSCAEAYSATNTALLRNRGYMEFIEGTTTTKPKSIAFSHKTEPSSHKTTTRGDGKLGVDYIEQGAYIMEGELNVESTHDLLKTPVNEETPQISTELATRRQFQSQSQTQISNLMTQSLTDSSTLNDLEDDSFGVVTTNTHNTITSLTSKPTTTTEESEALTVVTSPMDSSSPKIKGMLKDVHSQEDSKDNETPSSSDKNPKTSQSTGSVTTSSREGIPASNSSSLSGHQRKISTPTATGEEQLSYEEYVRALQQKITQISTAGLRDSLDARKQRRKSSKGDAPAVGLASTVNTIQTVIDQTPQTQTQKPKATETNTNDSTKHEIPIPEDCTTSGPTVNANTNTSTMQIHKVPEIPTLSRRLEEITKERTKQKDLIHDLVMDKLQSKKQLNAEKRLHRSRQRNMLNVGGNGGYSSGSSLSPTPKIAAASTVSDANCANKAHYHISTAVPIVPSSTTDRQPLKESTFQKIVPHTRNYGDNFNILPTYNSSAMNRHRPLSAQLDSNDLEGNENYELNKTVSSAHVPVGVEGIPKSDGKKLTHITVNYVFTKPKSSQPTVPGKLLTSASTESLRSEARARARLKSNSELGLSPEEKKHLLRNRLFSEKKAHSNEPSSSGNGYSLRDHKMTTSKSVNDLALISALRSNPPADENINTTKSIPALNDFTSDPNLLLSLTSVTTDDNPRPITKPNRRQKDPERRKSLIQSISSLFHKDKKIKSPDSNVTTSAANSAQAERPGTSGSSTTTASGSVDGVFSLFRISPKSKEKSKDKDVNSMNSAARKTQHERSNSQDCMLDTPSKLQINKHNKKLLTTATRNIPSKSSSAFSSSSPQLYIHRPSYMNTANEEQTPPPIPPLPLNYQRSDDESYATETREQKKQRAISKAVRQAELKRLRIAQEIQREQEEIEVQLKELEARGVLIEKALRGEDENVDSAETANNIGNSDERLLKELLQIWRNINQLKKRDEELSIRQQELQLEHRHAQLKEELNLRLSCNKLDKSSADVAAEGAILNEMLEIVAKRASLRPTASNVELTKSPVDCLPSTASTSTAARNALTSPTIEGINLSTRGAQLHETNESNI